MGAGFPALHFLNKQIGGVGSDLGNVLANAGDGVARAVDRKRDESDVTGSPAHQLLIAQGEDDGVDPVAGDPVSDVS